MGLLEEMAALEGVAETLTALVEQDQQVKAKTVGLVEALE